MSDWSSNIVDCDLVDARKFAEKHFEMDPFSSVFDRSPLSNLVERRERGPQIKHWRKFRSGNRLVDRPISGSICPDRCFWNHDSALCKSTSSRVSASRITSLVCLSFCTAVFSLFSCLPRAWYFPKPTWRNSFFPSPIHQINVFSFQFLLSFFSLEQRLQ